MVILMADDKLTMEQLEERKTQKTMRTVARRASYYRENPHRFAEVLGFHLKLFQKILIYAMMHYDFFMFIAARSTGKQNCPCAELSGKVLRIGQPEPKVTLSVVRGNA